MGLRPTGQITSCLVALVGMHRRNVAPLKGRIAAARENDGMKRAKMMLWLGVAICLVAGGAWAQLESDALGSMPKALGDASIAFAVLTGQAVGMGHDGHGNLYVTNVSADTCELYSSTGTLISQFGVTSQPMDVTTDGTNIYITDLGRQMVDIYALDGTYQSGFLVSAETTWPKGITYEPLTGHLFVVENDNNAPDHILEYTTDGIFVGQTALATERNFGIAWDPKRQVFWVYALKDDSLTSYGRDLTVLETYTGPRTAGYGSGEGVAVINDTVYVMDFNNDQAIAFDMAVAASTYNLTTGTQGGGSISPNSGVYYDYRLGDQVSVTATPDNGWTFSGWAGDATGATNPLTVTMDANKTVTAIFTEILPSISLTIGQTGSGTTTPSAGTYTYPTETGVELFAAPANGWVFSGWTGDLTSAANPLRIMLNADTAVTAVFVEEGSNGVQCPTASTGTTPGGSLGDQAVLLLAVGALVMASRFHRSRQ